MCQSFFQYQYHFSNIFSVALPLKVETVFLLAINFLLAITIFFFLLPINIYIYIILSRINKTTTNVLLKVSRFFHDLQVNYINIFIVKQHVGRIARQPIWVLRIFEIADTSFQPMRGYMEIVRRRNRAVLTNILNAKLAANSVIHSDRWRGYQNISQHVPAFI